MDEITLQNMVGGALQEQFEKSFIKVLENLMDPNTPYKTARKINIELKFDQNEMRDNVTCNIKVSEKLAAQAPMQTNFATGTNLKTGKVYAEEYGKHIQLRGQMKIDDESIEVDPDTGEVIEPIRPKLIALG